MKRRAPVFASSHSDQEETMRNIQLLSTSLLFVAALGTTDLANAIETTNPAVPQQPTTQQPPNPSGHRARTKKPKPKRHSSTENFLAGYRAAYTLIYDKNDYVGGIAELRALGYDDNPDVATLIGYASRKLGRYADAKYWYDKALAADPNHVVTWSYYGMWQAEQGNMLKAKDDLEKVRTLCGNTDCEAYTKLKAVIDGTVTY
jgi:tetratricopeptide (TPR) repeat protein